MFLGNEKFCACLSLFLSKRGVVVLWWDLLLCLGQFDTIDDENLSLKSSSRGDNYMIGRRE